MGICRLELEGGHLTLLFVINNATRFRLKKQKKIEKPCKFSFVRFLFFFFSEQTCSKDVDIAVVVDESGSIGWTNFEKVKSFLKEIISRFNLAPFGAHFAITKYSSDPSLVFSLARFTNATEMQTAVENMRYQGGGSYTGKALEYIRINVITLLLNVYDSNSSAGTTAEAICIQTQIF